MIYFVNSTKTRRNSKESLLRLTMCTPLSSRDCARSMKVRNVESIIKLMHCEMSSITREKKLKERKEKQMN